MARYERRHSRWYEVLLLSPWLQLIAGLFVVVYIPSVFIWSYRFWEPFESSVITSVTSTSIVFFVVFMVLRRVDNYSATGTLAFVLPVVSTGFLLVFAILFFTRSRYARALLLVAYILMLAWFYLGYFIGKGMHRRKLAFLPMKRDIPVPSTSKVEIRMLEVPDLEGVRYDGIVANLRSSTMTPEWERFLAECILARIPVFHVRTVLEEMTGKVELDHLLENHAGALLPSPLYSSFKRFMDVVGTLLLSPLLVVLALIIAVAIKLDSRGPVLFVQNRVGLSGQNFRMYKFRSMRVNAEAQGAKMAGMDDRRVTRVGRLLRKTRLDELPQFFNILKGDMSLIGPRPEQRAFVDRFEKEIPFYTYRHVVRPGISGWAQVTQGYAGNADETRLKIQHDFYYIKHFSLWLDILIVFKTIPVMFSGFGAR